MMRLLILACLMSATASAETRTVRLRVTAYCDRGRTASGRMAGPGQCAAPAWVPFGSKVCVDGKVYVATDRTAKRFRQNTVDIWMPTRQRCMNWGVRYIDVRIEVKR